ncbi:MAG: CBS domain-containing protein [Acidobacteriota bacterium]
MSRNVIRAQPHHTVAHVRGLLERNKLHAVPVVNSDDQPVGIVSAVDLLAANDGTPITKVMTDRVYTIPEYNSVHQAARLMRNQRIHHAVVTHEKAIVGIISSFDLLRLVEDHRFVVKPGPTPKKRS